MKKLHFLYEKVLANHLHLLPQKKIASMRDLFELLPNKPECLDFDYISDMFSHLSQGEFNLILLRLRPIEEALGRDITGTAKPNLVKTTEHPSYFYEVLDAVIVMLKAKRETQNQTLLSQRNIKRAIGEHLGIAWKKVNYNLTRFVESQLQTAGIIEFWDESPHHTLSRKTYRVNVTALDAHEKTRMES